MCSFLRFRQVLSIDPAARPRAICALVALQATVYTTHVVQRLVIPGLVSQIARTRIPLTVALLSESHGRVVPIGRHFGQMKPMRLPL